MSLVSRLLASALAGCLCSIASAQPTEPVRDAPALARETLRDEARQWVASQTGADPSWVHVASLDARVAPPPCENGFRFDFPFESRGTLRAQCDRPVRQYYMRVSTERPKLRLVANRPLAAGALISASDLTPRDMGSQAAGVEDPSLVVGRFLRRPLEAGELLTQNDLEERVAVLKASRDLRSGDKVDTDSARLEMVPRTRAPAGALATLEDLKQAKVRRDIPADRVLTADDLIDPRPAVVATRNMLRGEAVSAAALEVVEVDRRKLPPDYVAGLQGLEGAEVMAPVRAGEPLRASQVRPSLMVRRGQPVLFTVSRAGLEISIQVEALEDARLGESVKLRNPESGKSLGGTVTGRGTARSL